MKSRPAYDQPAYVPTPGDIERACEQIQQTWTPRERAKRAVERTKPVVLPVCEERSLHSQQANSSTLL